MGDTRELILSDVLQVVLICNTVTSSTFPATSTLQLLYFPAISTA